MPSPLTSSFASAAAGNTHDTMGSRGSGSGEWSRNRTNGATQTFRRPSLATSLSHNRESSQPTNPTQSNNTGAYIPPHMSSSYRNGTASDTRYNKEQLINIYKTQKDAGTLNKNLTELFSGGWNPIESRNGAAGSWGRREEGKDPLTGPEVCWEPNGKVLPLALSDMSDDEKELFASSVNSPLKGPSSTKEGTPSSVGNRKTSISQNGQYNASPHSGRPGPRRRETGESISAPNPLSPTSERRFFRDEPNTSTPPAALLRRKTDLKDPSTSETKSNSKGKDENRDSIGDTSSPFDSLKRRTTAGQGGPLSAGLSGPESPWSAGPHSATFGTMGAFGSFSLGPGSGNPESTEKDKRPGFGSMRGESRFKGLLSKGSSEDIASASQEKSSASNLERLSEDALAEGQPEWDSNRQPRQNRSVTNPYEDEVLHGGSAGLGGSLDADPRRPTQEDFGFSAFGDTIRNLVDAHPRSYHHTPQSRQTSQEPMSPTITNPYQSPEGDNGFPEDGSQDMLESRRLNFPGLGSLREDSSADAFGSARGKAQVSGLDDRSQTSSTGPNRMFPAFGGLGGLPNVGGPSPWSANPIASTNTPTKDRSGFPTAFGESMFGSMAEMQSPSMGPGGSGFFGGPSNTGTFGRASKMGSLFPQAMQDQMKNRPGSAGEGFGGLRAGGEPQTSTSPGFFGDIGGFDPSGRMPRGLEEGIMQDSNYPFAQAGFGQPPSAPGSGAMSKVRPAEGQQGQNLSQSSGSSNSNQLPAAQQRQMVMPDRMRWIYRDPQGNTQGPWSGLEMHDWFKAGFFTAELQVKKLEDADYEPLAQLVRRIGNSREPFLVPQIGVPHGPPAPIPGNNWPGASSHISGGVPQGSGTQPPFANSFPSFGTTLTAEQQNALERRKQEEQYLMARQKEHLAQQQVLMKQMGMQGGPHSMHQHGLQHHGSAQSLHSQPSFGSITSPSGYQPSPVQGPIQPPPMGGFTEGAFRPAPQSSAGPSGPGNDADDLPPFFERMNVTRGGQPPFGPGAFGGRGADAPQQQAIGGMLQDRARLQAEQQQHMKLSGEPMPEFQNNDRLQQFHDLTGQGDDNLGFQQVAGPSAIPIGGARPRQDESAKQAATRENKEMQDSPEPEMLSLSEQAQNVAATQQQPPSVWAQRIEQSVLPPPQSATPLPAPAAQRRQILADNLVGETRSQTQTPIETPSASIAPWADKTSELPKGPSLKEIQEAEARKAAKQEEMAAAARRAQAQAQAEMERQQAAAVTAPAPGLPSSSTWANPNSPATPTTGGSVWAKPANNKTAIATPPSAAKKTLAQIQKEEEARKQKVASATAVAQSTNTSSANLSGGKRYAELASKAVPATPQAVAGSSAWTTVGSGGKVKAPATVIATPGAAQRAPSGSVPVQAKARPTAARAPGSAMASQSASQTKATEELTKWAKGQLGKGLASGINVDDFVQSLLILPNETEIISDSVYANSQTLDGRRFAEEYFRKRKLAEKGVVESGASSISPAAGESKNGAAGGWSEVAKKGPEKRDESASNSTFKVVAGKKKGRR